MKQNPTITEIYQIDFYLVGFLTWVLILIYTIGVVSVERDLKRISSVALNAISKSGQDQDILRQW